MTHQIVEQNDRGRGPVERDNTRETAPKETCRRPGLTEQRFGDVDDDKSGDDEEDIDACAAGGKREGDGLPLELPRQFEREMVEGDGKRCQGAQDLNEGERLPTPSRRPDPEAGDAMFHCPPTDITCYAKPRAGDDQTSARRCEPRPAGRTRERAATMRLARPVIALRRPPAAMAADAPAAKPPPSGKNPAA